MSTAEVQRFDANGVPLNEAPAVHSSPVDEATAPSRAEWLQARKGAIGASDVAGILGISPFVSEWEVWADKTDRITERKDTKSTKAGKTFENVVLDHAEMQLGAIDRNVRLVHPELPIASTLDAQRCLSKEPIEAKVTGIEGPVFGDWGQALTDEIPDYYLVQVHTQLLVTGAELAYLFALIGGRGVVPYQIRRSESVCDKLAQLCTDWWEKHVVRDKPPALKSTPALEVVKRFRKKPKKTIVFDMVTASLISKRSMLKEQEKAIATELEQTEAELLLNLGDAEAAELPDGRMLTHYETRNNGYTVEPFTYRTMRIVDPTKKKPRKVKAK